MDTQEFELLIVRTVERVLKGSPIEDSRFEVKSAWPEPAALARGIAGQANASGRSFIWIIGVDQKGRRIISATDKELAEYWPQVSKCFDEDFAPRLVQYLNVPFKGKTVVGLEFDGSRGPFLTKNPNHGTTRGDSIALEVPWREATSLRSVPEWISSRCSFHSQAFPPKAS